MALDEAVRIARGVEAQAVRGANRDRALLVKQAIEILIALAEGK
jgi:hypothetical protein